MALHSTLLLGYIILKMRSLGSRVLYLPQNTYLIPSPCNEPPAPPKYKCPQIEDTCIV